MTRSLLFSLAYIIVTGESEKEAKNDAMLERERRAESSKCVTSNAIRPLYIKVEEGIENANAINGI